MLNLIKMDLRRTFRTPLLYALLLGLGVMVGTFAMTGIMGSGDSIASLIGPVSYTGDRMGGMGISMVLIFGAVYAVSIIGQDFSTGFIKNIMTVHADKKSYVLAKLAVSGVASAVMIVFYVLLMMVLGLIQGLPMGIASASGMILYLLGKWVLAVALNALVIAFILLFRNLPVSIIACFVFGMGGIGMILSMMAGMLGMPILQTIAGFTIAGRNGLGVVTGGIGDFVPVLIVAAVWLLVSLGCSLVTMKKKDI